MSKGHYKQMCGRAGRAGFGLAGESILIVPPQDRQKVQHQRSRSLPLWSASSLAFGHGRYSPVAVSKSECARGCQCVKSHTACFMTSSELVSSLLPVACAGAEVAFQPSGALPQCTAGERRASHCSSPAGGCGFEGKQACPTYAQLTQADCLHPSPSHPPAGHRTIRSDAAHGPDPALHPTTTGGAET